MKQSSSSRATQRTAFIGLAFGSLMLACHLEPQADDLHYSLGDDTRMQLADSELADPVAVGDRILGALEWLFGTPSNPQYLQLEAWEDDEFDPNYGSFELDDEAYDTVVAENERRFKLQLQLIDARRYAEVAKPAWADDLWANWQDHLVGLVGDPTAADEALHAGDPDAPFDPDDDEYGTRHEEARRLFTSWYPTLAESAEMYRQQCLHCHGTEGAGNGPTAPYLNPLPRDYRQGKFKWTAVDRNFRPRRADLLSILMNGSKGTAMPSFARFSRGELEGLVDYVRLLSVRGEVEAYMAGEAINEEVLPAAAALDGYDLSWSRWREADEKYVAASSEVPLPTAVTAEMLQHGKELFEGTVANCYTCHGYDGRGNGESLFEADPAGTMTVDEDGNEVPVMTKRLDEWGNESDPRNFHRAIFRGGNRPIDLFRRIKYGISGTIMPAADSSITDDDIWALAYYVLSIAEEHDVARLMEKKQHALEEQHAESHAEPASHDSGH